MDLSMEQFLELYALPWAIKIVQALAIFIIGKWLAGRFTKMLTRVLERTRLDLMLVKFLGNLAYAAMLVAVVLAAVDTLGINVTSFLAIVGAAGLAVGLALKDSLSNFAAGVMIILFRPFSIGDSITAGGTSGTVDEIGMFATLLRTADNQRIIAPNSSIINGIIVNANTLGIRRIDLFIGISYDHNIQRAKEIITSVVESDERVLKEPAFALGVQELGQNNISLYVQPWVKAGDYGAVRSSLLERIRTALDAEDITTPYPRQDVFAHVQAQPQEEKA